MKAALGAYVQSLTRSNDLHQIRKTGLAFLRAEELQPKFIDAMERAGQSLVKGSLI